jgi:hypothetical protein
MQSSNSSSNDKGAPLEGKAAASAQERRQTTRVECCYQVLAREGESRFTASVVNMGMGGIRLLSSRLFSQDDSLTLEQSATHSGPVTLRVVWSRPHPEPSAAPDEPCYVTGAVYQGSVEQLENSWVKPALRRLGFEALSGRERRRHVRARAEVDARLWIGEPLSMRGFRCQVIDLGLGGALIRIDESLSAQAGTAVSLEVAVGETERLPARVIYERVAPGAEFPRYYGLSFETDAVTRAQTRLVESLLQSMIG